MTLRITRYYFITAILALVASLLFTSPLISQFLDLEEDTPQKKIEEKVSTVEEKPSLPPSAARKIRAEHFNEMKGVIKITWDVAPDYSDEFIVGRGTLVIDSKIKALEAETVQIVQSASVNEALDFLSTSGSFYYVVLSKKRIKANDITLYKDENYTTSPVVITPSDVYYHVKEIEAKTYDQQRATVTWQKLNRSGLVYSLYRATRRLDSWEKLQTSVKVAELTDKGEHLDEGIQAPGMYFYAVTARDPKAQERFYPQPDHNFTLSGVRIKANEVNQTLLYRIRSIDASPHNKGVRIRWTYTGSVGGKYYRIFRSMKYISSVKEISEDIFISDADITKKSFFDPAPPAGEHYYGILPYGFAEENTPVLRGVNITNYTVKVEGSYKETVKLEPIVPDKETKKEIRELIPDYTGGDVDIILHRTFFKGKFDNCVKELKNAVSATDNETDKAKANMFIGRSYIEMGNYRKALDYLLLDDVKKHYPKESNFWQEQALRRLK